MTPRPRRATQRGQAGGRAALALVAKPATASADAHLLTLAAEFRELEEALRGGCQGQDNLDDTPGGVVLGQAIGAWVARMTAIRAAGLLGIAAKAGRLCWSHQVGHGLMTCEEPLLGSLAEDLARQAPEAVGGAA